MYHNDTKLAELKNKRDSSRRRMITGIVFMAVALVLETVSGFFLGLAEGLYEPELAIVGFVFLFISLPFFGMGIPFFITGLIGLIKGNNRIREYEEELAAMRFAEQPNYGAPQSHDSNNNP